MYGTEWPFLCWCAVNHSLTHSLLRKPSSNPLCPKFSCHGNEGRSGKNLVGNIRWPIPENPTIDAKILQRSLTQTELWWILSQNLLPWQKRSPGEKFKWQHQIARPRKYGGRCKQRATIFLRGLSYSQSCPKIRCHGNRSWQGKI